MKEYEGVALRLTQELAALAYELEEQHVPLRGQRLLETTNALGEEAAIHWLQTGQRPTSQESKAAAFPRFWFARMFLEHAILHGSREVIALGRPSAVPAILMLEVWESSGRALWEAPKKDVPWAG